MNSTSLPPTGGQTWIVWSSTTDSVEKEIFSVLACAEVIAAIAVYWLVAILFHTQTHLWLSIAIAPLLLLRSDASVALGVKWFENFADHGFRQHPKRAIRSPALWIAAVAAGMVVPVVAYLVARLSLDSPGLWIPSILGALTGYLSSQAGIATALAIAANELGAVLAWRLVAVGIAVSVVFAVGLGVVLSGVGAIPASAAMITTLLLSTIGAFAASGVEQSLARNETPSRIESRGVTAARNMLVIAPFSFAVFAPGVFFGGWLRSVGIRFAATVCHLWAGLITLPTNWWRTLFVVDFRYPPEIIPGYRGADLLQTSYMIKEIKNVNNHIEWFVFLTGFIVMFGPAYVYRVTIKSTCWFYLPLIYIMRERRFASNPSLLADLLWISPFEWWRRLLAVLVLATFLISRGVPPGTTAALPAEIVTPLEYVLLLDFHHIKPWQWFNLSSALITLAIFVCVSTFRIFVKHLDSDASAWRFVAWRSYFLEYAMRLRNISTSLFMLLAFGHVLLWQVPDQLPAYFLTLLRKVFA